MNLIDIDKNFNTTFIEPDDIEWFSALQVPFKIFGVDYSDKEKIFRRMPQIIANKISDGVSTLSTNTSGGRLKFSTDSPYIAIRCVQPFSNPMTHMTNVAKGGFSLFVDGKFASMFAPTYAQYKNGEECGQIVFDGMKNLESTKRCDITLFFPLYSGVSKLYIGLKKGCKLDSPIPYKKSGRILFYGSSVTQGACASKPGDDYVNLISQRLDIDVINLGFSGSAKAEKRMINYIADIDARAYVFEYDYNSPSVEHLKITHFELYKTLRKNQPQKPILFMTKPTMNEFMSDNDRHRYDIIKNTCYHAKKVGDKNVYFINLHGCLLDKQKNLYGTVDNIHPNSLGFAKIADIIYPVLKKLLNNI